MRKLVRRVLAASAVAATTVALAAIPASAAPATWTVTPGGAITGDNTQIIRWANQNSGIWMSCSVSSVSGSMLGGTGLPGSGIAALPTATFNACGSALASATVTATNLPWTFNAISYNSSTGVTSGTLTGFAATVTHNSVPACTFTIGGSGTVSANFTNSTDMLDVAGTNLAVQTTSGYGCVFNQPGDSIWLAGQYQLTSGQTITSP